ncbi:hypothetical protein [Tenacibaculum aiptasiae]|uniref:hypothetical protein n=1 Tax=Tenacibaculum aiptasiae TaxID=426481 RepID=UPI00232BC8FE|nr:hypothetical protein [Tenacibaculum aiptasiae]
MKKTITSLLFCLSAIVYGQKDITTVKVEENKVTSLIFSVDSVEELKTINWNDVKEVFKSNKDSNEKIALGFTVKKHKKNSKLKFKHSFKVKSELSDLDGTIEMTKRMIKVIENL